MAYVIVKEFVGWTQDQYEAAVSVLDPPGGLPAGQTHRYAGPSAAGWIAVAVWDSKRTGTSFATRL